MGRMDKPLISFPWGSRGVAPHVAMYTPVWIAHSGSQGRTARAMRDLRAGEDLVASRLDTRMGKPTAGGGAHTVHTVC